MVLSHSRTLAGPTTSLFGIFLQISKRCPPSEPSQYTMKLAECRLGVNSQAPPARCPPVGHRLTTVSHQPWSLGQVQCKEGDRSPGKSDLATKINSEVYR